MRYSKNRFAIKTEHKLSGQVGFEFESLDTSSLQNSLEPGKIVYFFCDDFDGPKSGGLYDRGVIQSATSTLMLKLDGTYPSVPLKNYHLDAFSEPPDESKGVARESVLRDIGELRRLTSRSGLAAKIYDIPEDSGVWMDVYHFHC